MVPICLLIHVFTVSRTTQFLKKKGYGVRIGSFDDPWHSFQQDSGVEVDAKQFQEYSLVAGKRERSPAVIFC